jgi:glycosidase
MENFYTKLLTLKIKNHALYSGSEGGDMLPVNSNNKNVYAFIREKGKDKVFVVVNLSKENQDAELTSNDLKGNYKELFSGKKVSFDNKASMQLSQWDYRVYVK